jgi:sialate O-acetylesterase
MHRTLSRNHALAAAIIIISILFSSGSALSDVTLPGIFGDGMVLQRDMKIPVWGNADPGEMVTVTLGGRSRRVKTEGDGTWMVRLKKMNAGGPYEMAVTGANEIRFGDVMIGEVWVCAGQSNMNYRIGNLGDISERLADADNPWIRMISVDRKKHTEPQFDFIGENAGWIACTPETVKGFSAVAYFFGRDLSRELDVPIGLINASWGGSQAEMWTPFEEIAANPALSPIIDRWEELHEDYPRAKAEYDKAFEAWKKSQTDGKPVTKRPWAPPGSTRNNFPGGIYNAMLHPVIPYGIKGAIWYQGESNSQRGFQYRALFKTMITSWRDKWGQGTFPFLFVQLANWETDTNPYSPKDGGHWPELREAQLMALELPRTAMTVAIDLGEETDIHPKNKWDVGRRLALGAMNIAYGSKSEYSGPLYRSVKFKKNIAVVRFRHDDGLTAKGGTLEGFEIAGADKVFHPAEALVDGNSVIVSGADVSAPEAVRYAWDDYPRCNLYNSAGLPASPFRTDDWPRETEEFLKPYFWRK